MTDQALRAARAPRRRGPAPEPLAPDHAFPGGSEMARRMREFAWGSTALGPVEEWPQSLLTSLDICLTCAFPIVIWWGPELAIFYNDEYRDVMGPAKHPAALGQPGSKIWAEIWDIIGPMLAHVVATGEATRSRDLLLHVDRGYREEAYFSFSYSPIHDDGVVRGIFCPVIETTGKVIGERRLRTLRDLAASCKGAESETRAYRAAAEVLAANPYDVPFAMIYRVDDAESRATLEAHAGIEAGAIALPDTIALDARTPSAWPLGEVADSGQPTLVGDLGERFAALPTGAWDTPAHSALILPVLLPGQERPRALLVAAVSPMRMLDEDYRTFLTLIASQIAAGVADSQALEEERRRAAALAEIDRAKTAFFSNVSHEFRTPLTLMLGPLEEALASARSVLPASVSDRLAMAHRNGLRLLKLVNTLLDFSRIEAGRIEASFEPVDLAAVTAELASVFRSAVESAGLRYVVDCPPLPTHVHVDRDMWEKIVFNLLSNAFKFTFEGEIALALRLTGDHAELSVRDTGVGIPAAELPRVFERFHSVKRTRSRTHEGSGIGLALVQELVRLHGGDITVTSVEGEGTRFTVTLPSGVAHLPAERIGLARERSGSGLQGAAFVDEAMRWLTPAGGAGGPVARGPSAIGDVDVNPLLPVGAPRAAGAAVARVLVADDNADMRGYVRTLLAGDYAVELAADGQAALERIREAPPDLVLSDVMMPRLDGFGLLAAIRADERLAGLPVILLSARAGEESRVEGLRAGADGYLTKPFVARELIATVASQLELARVRREAETALRTRGMQYETLLNHAPVGVYLVDSEFRIRELNPAARPAFDEVPGGVVGRDFDEVVHLVWNASYADEIVGIFRHVLATGESHFVPERGERRADRQAIEWYEWRADRIMLPEGRYGVVCYFRDISERKRSEAMLRDSEERLIEADRRKDEFLATLAHELRNPLAPVRNAVQLLRLKGSVEPQVEWAQALIERQVDQLARLVEDLVDVSRITRNKLELRREQVTITEVLQGAIESSRPGIEARKHELRVAVPEEPVFVNGDMVRLAQVFTNLLNNAAKYTSPGGTIDVRADRVADQVVVRVQDTGVGIPLAQLPHVFEMFFQAGPLVGRPAGGLGIGLSIVRYLVEMHGGTVAVHSAGVGCGSEFIVTLPVADDLPARSELEIVEDPVATHVSPRRMLVVDDNQDAAASLALLLEFAGHEVYTAFDGLQAIEMADRLRPDVVLLDIGLPRLNGYEVALRIRQRTWGKRTVLVALTGWGQSEDRARSHRVGFNCHLVKPVSHELLNQLLAELLAVADEDLAAE